MSSNIVNNYATTIVTIFKDVVEKYEDNIRVIKQAEDEINDLHHEIELSNPKDMYKGYLVYKEIREGRIRRRTAKEENEILKDMYEYLISQNGQSFKNRIQTIQSNSMKVVSHQEQRTYRPRQREDLTIVDKHVETEKTFEEMLKEFNNKNKVHVSGGKMRK